MNDPTDSESEAGTVAPSAESGTERVVYAHEIRPGQGVRLLVTGELDTRMLACIGDFAAFLKTQIERTDE